MKSVDQIETQQQRRDDDDDGAHHHQANEPRRDDDRRNHIEKSRKDVERDIRQAPPSDNNNNIRDAPATPPATPPVSPIHYCDIKSKDAKSAIDRAKTETCRNMIRNVTCRDQRGELYDPTIKNACPLGRNPARQFEHVPYDKGKGPLPRIVFLLSVNGRAVRQVQRLFKAIYHSDHYYFIHVDARADLLHRELSKLIGHLPNVHMSQWRMSTIWGGASLLKMLLQALEDLEYKLNHWKWDFFINLSESDFPLKTNDELVQFLRVHRYSNFVKTHGGDINKFIQKQGLDRTFVECENHMWRVGNRHLPPDITIDGGSDWIAINRNYSHYLVTNNDPYLNGLKKYYEYSLLPAESFFHTVLRNGPLCHTLVRTNLRVTNWNRKLGCRCQYKHIVDWCGCSPNDFLPKDISRLKNPGDHHFFARKFEAIVNQQIINDFSSSLYGPYPSDMASLDSYWQNVYHHQDTMTRPSSAHYTVYNSFLRHSLLYISKYETDPDCPPIPTDVSIREVNVYYLKDVFSGFLVKFQDNEDSSRPIYETYFVQKFHLETSDISNEFIKRITGIEVGAVWDGKESIFRNYGGILGVHDSPVVAMRMMVGRIGHVTVVWQDPVGQMVERHDVKLEAGMTVAFHKLSLEKPLMPGIWKVWIEVESNIHMLQRFLITPVSYDKDVPLDNPVAVNGKHIGALVADANTDRYIKWRDNVIKTGADLSDWIDQLIDEFWFVQDVCLTSACSGIMSCDQSSWSSLYPDPKSNIIIH
jgi:protein xylosyltransferase